MSGKGIGLKIKCWTEPSLLFKKGLTERIPDPRYGLVWPLRL